MIIAQDKRIVKCPAQDPGIQFLQYPVYRLCYDEFACMHGGRAQHRKRTGWTLSRSWIR
jgi:hypothetical protein